MEISATSSPARAATRLRDAELREAALKLEASFLAEMLKAAGLGRMSSEFGGGPGEEQFASFLVRAQAEKMVSTGGIGLAQTIFDALKEQQDAADTR